MGTCSVARIERLGARLWGNVQFHLLLHFQREMPHHWTVFPESMMDAIFSATIDFLSPLGEPGDRSLLQPAGGQGASPRLPKEGAKKLPEHSQARALDALDYVAALDPKGTWLQQWAASTSGARLLVAALKKTPLLPHLLAVCIEAQPPTPYAPAEGAAVPPPPAPPPQHRGRRMSLSKLAELRALHSLGLVGAVLSHAPGRALLPVAVEKAFPEAAPAATVDMPRMLSCLVRHVAWPSILLNARHAHDARLAALSVLLAATWCPEESAPGSRGNPSPGKRGGDEDRGEEGCLFSASHVADLVAPLVIEHQRQLGRLGTASAAVQAHEVAMQVHQCVGAVLVELASRPPGLRLLLRPPPALSPALALWDGAAAGPALPALHLIASLVAAGMDAAPGSSGEVAGLYAHVLGAALLHPAAFDALDEHGLLTSLSASCARLARRRGSAVLHAAGWVGCRFPHWLGGVTGASLGLLALAWTPLGMLRAHTAGALPALADALTKAMCQLSESQGTRLHLELQYVASMLSTCEDGVAALHAAGLYRWAYTELEELLEDETLLQTLHDEPPCGGGARSAHFRAETVQAVLGAPGVYGHLRRLEAADACSSGGLGGLDAVLERLVVRQGGGCGLVQEAHQMGLRILRQLVGHLDTALLLQSDVAIAGALGIAGSATDSQDSHAPAAALVRRVSTSRAGVQDMNGIMRDQVAMLMTRLGGPTERQEFPGAWMLHPAEALRATRVDYHSPEVSPSASGKALLDALVRQLDAAVTITAEGCHARGLDWWRAVRSALLAALGKTTIPQPVCARLLKEVSKLMQLQLPNEAGRGPSTPSQAYWQARQPGSPHLSSQEAIDPCKRSAAQNDDGLSGRKTSGDAPTSGRTSGDAPGPSGRAHQAPGVRLWVEYASSQGAAATEDQAEGLRALLLWAEDGVRGGGAQLPEGTLRVGEQGAGNEGGLETREREMCTTGSNWLVGAIWMMMAEEQGAAGKVLQAMTGSLAGIVLWPAWAARWHGPAPHLSLCHAFHVVLQEQLPAVHAAFVASGVCPSQIMSRWASQCFANVLDWSDLMHYLCLCVVVGADYQIYLLVAIMHHLQDSIRIHHRDQTLSRWILASPVAGFSVHKHVAYMTCMETKYRRKILQLLNPFMYGPTLCSSKIAAS
ncbi:hypothetical protein CYMTET_30431 [Cymbomonas tetramitiformis]|uniref:BROMI C-terminal Rab TBC-like domain-containing protein n=1 Tax=Cymbomonas tetramitiformis TaxID=36881 RepID=A0AAE0FIV4_9CHLO|nr:hypothetical protein CYMTET_30431 [Cymbomonas tetramitiformis]